MKEEDKIVHGITDQNLWAHIQNEKLVQQMKFGTITVTFRVHNSEVTDLVVQQHARIRKPSVDKGK